jgi:CubicO group peptidase (beta-lactamase class C family)
MNRGIVVLLPLVVSLCITQGNPLIVEESAASGYDFTLLDSYLARKAPEHHGMALILVRDGNIIYDKGFAGVTSDTVMPIASASKWLSAGVIMALVDEGMLSLDDRTSDYLPGYTGEHGEMTVRQLFSHTSGLPGHYSSTGIPGSDDILGNRSITLAESVGMIADIELLADPGTQLYYGGLSMQVAGRIAEVASGEDWLDLFEEKIAHPLDMNETDFDGLGPTRNPRIAGSIQTSAHQYARFLQMLLAEGRYNGDQVLSPEAVHEMLKDQTFGVPIVYSPWQQYKHLSPVAQEVRYGIGCWCEVIDETGAIKEASSQGAFGFSPWIDVDRNLAGVLAVKSRLTGVMPLYLEMKEILREIVDTADAKQSSGTGSSPDIERDFDELYRGGTGPSFIEMAENSVVCDEAREKLRLRTTHSWSPVC